MSEHPPALRLDVPDGMVSVHSSVLAFGDDPPGVFLAQVDAVTTASILGDVLEGVEAGRPMQADELWVLRDLHRRLTACVADPYLRSRLAIEDGPARSAGSKSDQKAAKFRKPFFLRLTLPWKRRA